MLNLNKEDLVRYIGSTNVNKSNGLIQQYSGDSGDTLQRTASFYTCAKYLNILLSYKGILLYPSFLQDKQKLQVAPPYYARSCKTPDWYCDYEYTSRDQLGQFMISQAMMGDTKGLKENAKLLLKRFGLHYNYYHNGIPKAEQKKKMPDVMTLNQLATIIRGLNLWYLYPVLLVLDLDILFGVLVSVETNTWDQSNMLIPQLILSNKYPTIWSKLSISIAKRKQTKIVEQVTNYYSIPKNGIPALGELIIRAFKKVLTTSI